MKSIVAFLSLLGSSLGGFAQDAPATKPEEKGNVPGPNKIESVLDKQDGAVAPLRGVKPIDTPSDVKLGFVSGMVAGLEADNTFKLLIYGEHGPYGSIRLTPMVFGRVDRSGVAKITTDTVVKLDTSPTPVELKCYRGTIQCDSVKQRVEIHLEVKDGDVWKPFGWNGKWPLKLFPAPAEDKSLRAPR